MGRRIPVAEKLFTWPSNDPRLIAGRRTSDGRLVFPFPDGPEAAEYEPVELGSRGALWSYTVQRFPPKNPPFTGETDPRRFRPYAVGYVELPGELIVEARLDVDDLSSLVIGQPMEMAVIPFRTTEQGDEIVTYAFRPAA
jgi:uncharacterized OB-fold protein